MNLLLFTLTHRRLEQQQKKKKITPHAENIFGQGDNIYSDINNERGGKKTRFE